MDKKELIIKEFAPFELSDTDMQNAINQAKILNFNKGEILYKDKSACYGFLLVLSGVLRAFVLFANNKEITIFELEKGDECVLCAKCIAQNDELEINLEAMDEVKILVVAPEIFMPLRLKYPKLANFVLDLLAKRFNKSIQIMSHALFSTLNERIKSYLLSKANNNIVEKTHEQIANEIGSAREAVSRILKELESNRLLRLGRGKIILSDDFKF